jgi:hypothetical protein
MNESRSHDTQVQAVEGITRLIPRAHRVFKPLVYNHII